MRRRTPSSACSSFHDCAISRRAALKVGGLGMLGLTLPRLLRAQSVPMAPAAPVIRPRAKSVIFLYQFGGPSHLDMFDMKPDAPEGIRSPLGSISSSVPGLPICEHLPEVAKVMDRVTLVRSMHHNMKNHNSAAY